MGTAHSTCSCKRLNQPLCSPDLNGRLFCVSEVENGIEGGLICNLKRHSNICNDKTIPITDFSQAMHRLEDNVNQRITINDDYFE